MSVSIHIASIDDSDSIRELISQSARTLAKDDYSPQQIELALGSAWGLDTQLLRDQTYFLIKDNTNLAGCGGWSFRRTLFGSDGRSDRDNSTLNPAEDAAKIRAFFIHPDYARQGLGRKMLSYCEQKAWDAGFKRLELGATLPGQRLYARYGYKAGKVTEFPLPDELTLTIIPMYKTLKSRPEF